MIVKRRPHPSTDTPYAAPVGLTIRVGSLTLQPVYSSVFSVGVYNNQPSSLGVNADGLQAVTPTSLNGTSTVPGSLTVLAMLDRTQALYSSDALPSSLRASDFTDRLIQVVVPGQSAGTTVVALEGTVNLSAVPEPASMALLAIGGVGVFVAARFRRRSLPTGT